MGRHILIDGQSSKAINQTETYMQVNLSFKVTKQISMSENISPTKLPVMNKGDKSLKSCQNKEKRSLDSRKDSESSTDSLFWSLVQDLSLKRSRTVTESTLDENESFEQAKRENTERQQEALECYSMSLMGI